MYDWVVHQYPSLATSSSRLCHAAARKASSATPSEQQEAWLNFPNLNCISTLQAENLDNVSRLSKIQPPCRSHPVPALSKPRTYSSCLISMHSLMMLGLQEACESPSHTRMITQGNHLHRDHYFVGGHLLLEPKGHKASFLAKPILLGLLGRPIHNSQRQGPRLRIFQGQGLPSHYWEGNMAHSQHQLDVMGNHELSPLMLYASHLFTRLHGLKNTLLAGLAPSCRKVEHYSG